MCAILKIIKIPWGSYSFMINYADFVENGIESFEYAGYEFTRLCDSNIDDAVMICDKFLGYGLYKQSELVDISKNDKHYFYVIYHENQAIGIFYFFADLLQTLNDELSELIGEGLQPDSRIGVFRSMALLPEYRNGILTGCLSELVQCILYERECVEEIVALAWIKSEGIPVEQALVLSGYQRLGKVLHPWSKYEGLLCDECGSKPCKCDGMLYRFRK